MDIRMIRIRVRLIVEPDEDGFHVYCPELVGLHADGKTEKEAVKNGRDAAEAYLNALLKNNDPIPIEQKLDSLLKQLGA